MVLCRLDILDTPGNPNDGEEEQNLFDLGVKGGEGFVIWKI